MGVADLFKATDTFAISVPQFMSIYDRAVRFEYTKKMLENDIEPYKILNIISEKSEQEGDTE